MFRESAKWGTAPEECLAEGLSHDDKPFETGECGRSDSRDLVEILDGAKRSRGNDPFRHDRSDSGKTSIELFDRGGVEVKRGILNAI